MISSKGRYHNHHTNQKGWRPSSPGVGYANNQITDEEYYGSVAKHDPLWRYIVQHYPKEVYGQNLAEIVILGYPTLPVAIELSQWFYPVTFITDSQEELKKAKRDCEIQAGFLKERILFQYRHNVPRSAVTAFIGIIDEFPQDAQVMRYLDLLLRRCEEVVCAVALNRDWRAILEGKYDMKLLPYPDGIHGLLTIKEWES